MDKRYEKKEKLIKDTFKELLSKQYFENITVQELTSLAGIDRKTFYLHYDSLDELLKAIQEELSGEFNELVKGLNPIDDLDKVTREFFYFSESKGKFYEHLTINSEYSYVRNQMIKRVMIASVGERKSQTAENNFKIAFIVNTTLLFYSEWVRNGKEMPLDEIIELTIDTIRFGISK